jgi:CubicO group peptidase (beta-lactamase class C family)
MIRKLLNFIICLHFFLLFVAENAFADIERTTPAQAGFDASKLEAVKSVLDPLYEDGRIPNYVVILAKDEKVFFSASRGHTSLGGQRSVDENTVYLMASMSKPIVSSAIFALIDDGELGLEDKLNDFFPVFDQLLVAPGGSFDSAFEEPKRQITVKDLLTHTSGFTYGESVIGLGDVAKQYDEIGVITGEYRSKTIDENLEILAEIPLVAQPGTSFNYSVSTDILGAIIEKVEGKSLGDALKERMFEPLGMSETGFDGSDFSDSENIAHLYAIPQSGLRPIGRIEGSEIVWKLAGGFGLGGKPMAPTPGLGRGFDSGGGGLWGSGSDYIKYISMIASKGLFKGKRVLSETSVESQTSNLVPGLGLEAFESQFGSAAALMSFGGGFGIKRESAESDEVDYLYWGGICNTSFWIDPSDGSVGVFLTHACPGQYNVGDDLEEIVDKARF